MTKSEQINEATSDFNLAGPFEHILVLRRNDPIAVEMATLYLQMALDKFQMHEDSRAAMRLLSFLSGEA